MFPHWAAILAWWVTCMRLSPLSHFSERWNIESSIPKYGHGVCKSHWYNSRQELESEWKLSWLMFCQSLWQTLEILWPNMVMAHCLAIGGHTKCTSWHQKCILYWESAHMRVYIFKQVQVQFYTTRFIVDYEKFQQKSHKFYS